MSFQSRGSVAAAADAVFAAVAAAVVVVVGSCFRGFFREKKVAWSPETEKVCFGEDEKKSCLPVRSAQRQNISNLIICEADSNPGNKKSCLKKSFGSFQTFYFRGLNGHEIFFSAHLLIPISKFPHVEGLFPSLAGSNVKVTD